jgi:hypothetical protein
MQSDLSGLVLFPDGRGKAKKRGRTPFDKDNLGDRRDSLLGALSSWWAEMGWQLTHATTRQELRDAFKPLKATASCDLVAYFLHPTSATASRKEIRSIRRQRDKDIERRREAQAVHDRCVDAYREVEWAIGAAKPEQLEIVQRAFCKRRAEWQKAISELKDARAAENTREQQLVNVEAGFAQDELLKFIKKRFIEGRYAKNPLNLANAMAGLPSYSWGPFLGVWYSYGRYSKLKCKKWPLFPFQVFKTLEKIWNLYQRKPSPISAVEFLRQQIRALRKTIRPKISESAELSANQKRLVNPVRAHLVEKWVDLQLALEQSLISPVEPERMTFVIGTHFARIQMEPKTAVDRVIASARGIDD